MDGASIKWAGRAEACEITLASRDTSSSQVCQTTQPMASSVIAAIMPCEITQ